VTVRELIDTLDEYNRNLKVIVEIAESSSDFVIVSVDGTELDGEQVVCLSIGPDAV